MVVEKAPKLPTAKEKLDKTKTPETKDKKEKVPATKEAAKKAIKKETVKAKVKGKEKVAKAKEKKEKPQVTTLAICGKQIERRIVGGKVTFVEKGQKAPIVNLGEWVEKQMADKELQKQIDVHLKPYASQIKTLDEKKQAAAVKKLNDTKFTKLEFGKIDVYGKEIEDPVQKAAYLASVIAKKTSPRKLTISQKELDKVKHKAYLDYQHLLPTNVRTIVINRNGKKIVCSRSLSGPEKGGRVSYIDVASGKRIFLKGGDGVQIVGTVSAAVAMSMQKKEQAYAKVRSERGKTWKKDSGEVVDFNPKPTSSGSSGRSYSGYSGGGGGGGSYAPSYSPSSGSSSGGSVPSTVPATAPGTAPSKLAPNVPALKETPEEMHQHCTQETFRVPGKHMFASMLSPNPEKYPKLKKAKPKLIVYFAGRGYYDAITKWVRQHGRKQEPPPEVLAKAAREDFLSSNKRIFSMLKGRWAKGENVHFALVTHMRNFFSADEKESGKSGHWYNELQNASSANALFAWGGAVYKAKSGTKKIENVMFSGHIMGGKALAGIMKLMAEGKLNIKGSIHSSDASYWYYNLDLIKRNPKISLYLTFRPGTKTAIIAKKIIASLGLKGQRRGSEVVYTNLKKYPNIRVVASSASHSSHPGRYLNAAWELAQRAQAGTLDSQMA